MSRTPIVSLALFALIAALPAMALAQRGGRGEAGPTRELPAAQVRRLAAQALAEVLPQEVELRAVLWNQPVRLPRGAEVSAVAYLEGDEPVNDRLRARLELFVDDQSAQTIRLRLEVLDRRQVVVVTRQLRPGETVSESDVALRPLPPGVYVREPLRSLEGAIGYELTRLTDSGEILEQSSLRAPAAVRRRERVQLIARTGGVEVIAQGEPLEDGAIGEVIRVLCLMTRRTLEARVTGPGRVEVR